MTDVIVNITSARGDEYRIRLSSSGNRFLSEEISQEVKRSVDILTIELERIKGQLPTGHVVLSQIERVIAEVFLQNPNAVICFICDFLSPIPSSKKQIPVQQYRSILFTRMFERYVSQNSVGSVVQSVLTISGIGEDYYIHIIARSEHMRYVNMISDDIRVGYSK